MSALDVETATLLYTGLSNTCALAHHRQLRVAKLQEAIKNGAKGEDVEALCDETVERVKDVVDDGSLILTYLQEHLCSRVGQEEFDRIHQASMQAAEAISQHWSSDEDDSSVATSPSDDEAEPRKRRQHSSPERGEGGGKASGRGSKKRRRKLARKSAGADSGKAPADAGNPRKGVPVERGAVDYKAVLDEARRRAEEIEREFSASDGEGRIVLAKFGLVDAVIARIEEAVDPDEPNLAVVPHLMMSLARFFQNVSSYQTVIAAHMAAIAARATEDAQEYREDITSWGSDSSIGAIVLQLDKKEARRKKPKKNDKDLLSVPEELASLAAAISHFDGSEACALDRMSAVLDLGDAREFLLRNVGNMGMMVACMSAMKMVELYAGRPAALEEQAQKLWAVARPGERYDPEETSVGEYLQEAFVPGIANEQHKALALEVGKDIKSELTGNLTETNRGHYGASSSATLSGQKDASQANYCGGEGAVFNERRGRMAGVTSCVLFRELIEDRLPDGMFPRGFVRALLLNSPSRIKKNWDVTTRNRRCRRFVKFYDNVHGPESDIVKAIKSDVENTADVGEEVYIFDSAAQVENLKRLVGL